MQINVTIKEFKELIAKAEKEGEINDDSEIFILDEEDQVMCEPTLLTDAYRNLILKYSYRNEVLVNE